MQIRPKKTRFQLEPLLWSPPKTSARPVWQMSLWEACDLLGLVEELIAAVQESDADLVIPPGGPAPECR